MLHYINYIIKIAIIIIGIIFASGILAPSHEDINMFRIMGGVFILFGVYRIVIYKMKHREYNFKKVEEEDESK